MEEEKVCFRVAHFSSKNALPRGPWAISLSSHWPERGCEHAAEAGPSVTG